MAADCWIAGRRAAAELFAACEIARRNDMAGWLNGWLTIEAEKAARRRRRPVGSDSKEFRKFRRSLTGLRLVANDEQVLK